MITAILTAIIVFAFSVIALVMAGRHDQEDEFWAGGEWSDRQDDKDNSK